MLAAAYFITYTLSGVCAASSPSGRAFLFLCVTHTRTNYQKNFLFSQLSLFILPLSAEVESCEKHILYSQPS